MGQNILYNYIHNHIRGKAPKGCTQVSLKTDKASTSYYLLELPKKDLTLVDEKHNTYTLLSHHVSVYDNEQKSPFLSQFHYTGYFVDQNGKTCQLHVHFNGNDIPAFTNRNLNFSRQQGGPKLNSDLDDQWMSFVYSMIAEPMADLRKGMAAQVKILENDYLRLEQKASELSENLSPAGIKEYKQALLRVEKTLDQLIPLVSHPEYKKIQALISSLIHSIENLTPKPQVISRSGKKPSRKMVSPPQPILEPKQEDKQDNHLGTLKGLTDKYLTVCEQDLATQASGFASLRAEVFGFAAQLPHKAPLPLLKELKKLQGDIEKKGKNLLGEFLATDQFELAKQLTPFHYLLTHDTLIKALQENKPALLEFILKHGEIDVDQPFSLGNKFYQSAVDYCLINYPKETACLSFLVKHGCSLMIKDKQGLPFAYSLTDPQHPLYAVLNENLEQSLSSISFYKKLIASLQLYLRDKQSDRANLVSIQDKIIQYQEELQKLQLHNKLSAVNQIKLQTAVGQFVEKTARKIVRLPLIVRLQEDPELQNLMKQLQTTSNNHMEELSPTALNKEIKFKIDQLMQFNENSMFKNLYTPEVQAIFNEEKNYIPIRNFMISELEIDIRYAKLNMQKRCVSLKMAKSIALAENQLVQDRKRTRRELCNAFAENDPIQQAITSMQNVTEQTANLANSLNTFTQSMAMHIDEMSPEELSQIGKGLENLGNILSGIKSDSLEIGSNLDDSAESSSEVNIPELAPETLVFSVPNSATFFSSERQLKTLKSSAEFEEDQSSKGPPQ